MKKIIPVTKVAFHGSTGDNRSPEDLALPACMASLMEALGENYEIQTIHAHNQEYTKRTANDQFLGASGMAFGLLWHKEFCMSSMDVMQVNEHNETIRRAFAWAGYQYELIENNGSNTDEVFEKVAASINHSIPVLAFGLFGPPECAIVTGLDDADQTLIGWSHFQDFSNLSKEENGMFRVDNWQSSWWKFVIPKEKTQRTLSYHDAYLHGLKILRSTNIDNYLAGQAAYQEWIDSLLKLDGTDEKKLKSWYDYHNNILFNLAELRAWGANFMREGGADQAASCFNQIHDFCWKADAVTGPKRWEALKDEAKRKELADVLQSIQSLDFRAANELEQLLKSGNA